MVPKALLRSVGEWIGCAVIIVALVIDAVFVAGVVWLWWNREALGF